MSRIHEALKHVSRPATTDVRAASDVTLDAGSALDQYIPEPDARPPALAPAVVISPPPAAPPVAQSVAVSAPPEVKRRAVRYDPSLGGKLVVSDKIPAAAIVQYRRLATTLQELQLERGVNRLLVTSALPGDGRTMTVVNLALTLSENFGRRVLLLDADQRRPSLHEIFGVANTSGLNDVLRAARADVPLIRLGESLSVLTSGRLEPATTALTSARMKSVVAHLADQFDWVLLDAAPVAFLDDAASVARALGPVLFVVGAESTPCRRVAHAIADLGAEYVVGTVLNRVAPTADVLCVAR
jgi:capsular exopolysaccharide synthesis family protein